MPPTSAQSSQHPHVWHISPENKTNYGSFLTNQGPFLANFGVLLDQFWVLFDQFGVLLDHNKAAERQLPIQSHLTSQARPAMGFREIGGPCNWSPVLAQNRLPAS